MMIMQIALKPVSVENNPPTVPDPVEAPSFQLANRVHIILGEESGHDSTHGKRGAIYVYRDVRERWRFVASMIDPDNDDA